MKVIKQEIIFYYEMIKGNYLCILKIRKEKPSEKIRGLIHLSKIFQIKNNAKPIFKITPQ